MGRLKLTGSKPKKKIPSSKRKIHDMNIQNDIFYFPANKAALRNTFKDNPANIEEMKK